MSNPKSKSISSKLEVTTYWCTSCGHSIHYVDCGTLDVYQKCENCCDSAYGSLRLFSKHKDKVITYVDSRRRDTNRILCKLLGIRYEDVLARGGMHVVMAEWFNREKK